MATPRVEMLMRFLTNDLKLSADELRALRDGIDLDLGGVVPGSPPPARRTLYLPSDRMNEL